MPDRTRRGSGVAGLNGGEKAIKTAAIYARVSSDRQKQDNTIASQTAALIEFARNEGYQVPAEWVFEDAGYRAVQA